MRGRSQRAVRAYLDACLDGYIDRVTDRDISEQGRTFRSRAALRRWMAAYAAAKAYGDSELPEDQGPDAEDVADGIRAYFEAVETMLRS